MNSTALVTGAGGFIGSHLVERLLADGWSVRALVHGNGSSSWGWLEHLRGRNGSELEVLLGDVLDSDQMLRAMRECRVVFHLAAQIGIPNSFAAPRSFFETNAVGTLNVVRAALEAQSERLILASSSEVYGSARHVPMNEAHPLQARSPYAASKIAAEKIVESFIHAYDLPAVVVRPFNTYGPRQSTRAVVPTILTQSLDGGRIRLGSLEPGRDFTYVEDTVAGFLAAALADGAPGNIFNLGSGRAISIGGLVRACLAVLGRDLPVEIDQSRIRPGSSEVLEPVGDNRRAREILGWRPQVGLEDGLARTLEWVRSHQALRPAEHTARARRAGG